MTDPDEPLDSRRLRAFTLLAREASFAAAASALNLTPSAMSHSIRTLEEEMGGLLFDRRGHRAVLTAAGERLLPHAERILRQMRDARLDMQSLTEWGRGTLRIAAPASACQYFLPAVLLEFRECFPECTVNITAADTDAATRLLEDGRLDLAVCVRTPVAETLQWHPLFEDVLQFFVSPVHPWVSEPRLTRKDLATQPIIVYDQKTVTTRLIMASLAKLGIQPAGVLSLGSMEAIKEMVKVGLGTGVLAPWATVREVEGGTLVPVRFPIPAMRREWGALTWRSPRLSLISETFLGLCQDVTLAFAAA